MAFPLAVVQIIGRDAGLVLEEETRPGIKAAGYDAVFITALDSRCIADTARCFDWWGIDIDRRLRRASDPVVIAGGQGLHNPMPYEMVADVIVVGDGEDTVPPLVRAWQRTRNKQHLLVEATAIPGAMIPSIPECYPVTQSVAEDITASLREPIVVAGDGSRRMEIGRGCPRRCRFCELSHRAPYRENQTGLIIEALRKSPKSVNLMSGDANRHKGIEEIRAFCASHGIVDKAWTGSIESTDKLTTIPPHKRYALGIEGMTQAMRKRIGKGWISDERLLDFMDRAFDLIEGDGKGRFAWHMIAGLPGEKRSDVFSFISLITNLQKRRRGKTPARNLTIHWQPFQPMPRTPMQRCATGGGARRLAGTFKSLESDPWVPIRQHTGRTDTMAKICTVITRSSGERSLALLKALKSDKLSADQAADVAGVSYGEIPPGSPMPWEGKIIHRK
jgi:hypothetical protein